MEYILFLPERSIRCLLEKSARARKLSITVEHNGMVRVRVPKRVSYKEGIVFICEESRWILRNVKKREETVGINIPDISNSALKVLQAKVLRDVLSRISYFNTLYQFSLKKVAVKNMKSQWGSCSSQGNLNFAYKLHFLPKELGDYVIVHEMCHLQEFHHKESFWELVQRAIPDYKEREKRLRTYHLR